MGTVFFSFGASVGMSFLPIMYEMEVKKWKKVYMKRV
jgi:hypothetical protein